MRPGAGRRSQGKKPLSLVALLAAVLIAGGAGSAAPGFIARFAGVFGASASTNFSTTSDARDLAWTTWDEVSAPEYYRVLGAAQISVDLQPGEVRYADLDSLGRAAGAWANVTADLASQGSSRQREDMSALKPSGWGHNREVDIELADGTFYHGAFFNRSHLLAKSLGGEERLENLVCATRMQNVGSNKGDGGGMAYTEGLAREWLKCNPSGTVYYSAVPVYEGSQAVCRSVIVDVKSSDGTIDLEVEVHNAAKGYTIDYATGEFSQN